MAENSLIEWCHHTFNPWIGCTQISPGCVNCYAKAIDQHWYGAKHWGKEAPRKLMSDKYWLQPLKWDLRANKAGQRHRVFCASMADVFDEHAPTQERDRLFRLIDRTPNLDWLLLTKRLENIRKLWPFGWYDDQFKWPNVWLGVSVEDQANADERIPLLLQIPASVRFLSCEPLLGEIDLSRWLDPTGQDTCINCGDDKRRFLSTSELTTIEITDHGDALCPTCGEMRGLNGYDEGIDWVIVGAESGHAARPMQEQWARDIKNQCVAAGVPFFLKQYATTKGKKISLPLLDGQQWTQMPEMEGR